MRQSRRSSAPNRRNTIAGRWRPWLREDLPADGSDDATPPASAQAASEELSLWPDEASLGEAPPQRLRLE